MQQRLIAEATRLLLHGLKACPCCLQARERSLATFRLQRTEDLAEPVTVGGQLGMLTDKVPGAVERPCDLKIAGLGGQDVDQGLEFVGHQGTHLKRDSP